MFICEPCHTKANDCSMGFIEGFMRSRGSCEMCGKVASCLDCQGYKAKGSKVDSELEPQICGRCLGQVPCGCYSHESRLGLPYPSPPEKILEAYAEQNGKQFRQIIALKQLVNDDFWQAELSGTGFLDKLKEILDGQG